MKTNDIRQQFLNFFHTKGHTIVPSSPLVPSNDPTLLFTNAGMVQFKDLFLGVMQASYTRATSSQCCVRAGGKHNDLENVGYTARHHTFFEMLGNFSFGDYFKREAIQYAWTFLTDVLGLPAEKLWVTVFEEDDEAADIWLKDIGVSAERFSRIGAKDNFWSMGDTGPCGPCSEIFYDHGEEVAGGPPGSPDEDGDRYIEIWNLVFMQYDRNAAGELTPLPKPCVDTGMGLERVAAIMQGVHNNYDIDLFQSILKYLAKLIQFKDISNTSMRVISDHIRSTAFMIMDGVVPSNEGRGYVLRRIIRRAVRHGYKLGVSEPFFYKMLSPLIASMGDAYPGLAVQEVFIAQILLQEEEQFARTLSQGMKIFEQAVAELHDDLIPGALIFQLSDTYGFPTDLTADIARERGLKMDYDGFRHALAEQQARSRAGSQFKIDAIQALHINEQSEFVGYEQTSVSGNVLAIVVDGKPMQRLQVGQEGMLVFDRTPFYAESGGQVSDTGVWESSGLRFDVTDVRKLGDAVLHCGKLQQGEVVLGSVLQGQVSEQRSLIAANHSATHLLHKALKVVLGGHVQQKGSLVESARLRFDFSHPKPLTRAEIVIVENLVNAEIRANHVTTTTLMDIEAAKASGAQALFGEKYDTDVRVVAFGEFSKELCGGTHVKHTGDIGFFKIILEGSTAAGIRRVEAVTGAEALHFVQHEGEILQACVERLGASPENIESKLSQLQLSLKAAEKALAAVKDAEMKNKSAALLGQFTEVNGMPLLVAEVENVDKKTLRACIDEIKSRRADYVVLLFARNVEKVQFISAVSKSLVARVSAAELLKVVIEPLGGRGGGKPGLAQGGAADVEEASIVLQRCSDFILHKFI